MFKKTQALYKLLELKNRVRIVCGGTSAGKTICILLILIQDAIKNKGREVSVVASTVPALRRGVLKDFLKIMKTTNRYKEESFNKTTLKYTFSNGSYIEFFSIDQPDKIRGSRRTDLFINECNTIPNGFESYQQLAIRTSGKIWLDYNPTSLFWVDKELKGQQDTDFVRLTYKDNNTLPEGIIKELEKARDKAKTSSYWENWTRVYLDGLTGALQGVCIPDWQEIDKLPTEAKLLGYGMDFGYVDPTTIIALYKWNNAYIFDEVLYKSNMVLRDVSLFLTQNNIKENIIADHAEPKSIATLSMDGHKIYPCTKGRDSVTYGINMINQNEIYVTSNSKNLKRELQGYVWARDKEGNTIEKPTGVHPDCIDACRYILTDHLSTPKGEYYIY